MQQDFVRMTDKAHKPSEEEIANFIGMLAKEAWQEIKRFVETSYDLEPETIFYGDKYGWTIRYRKSGKTLCSLFPEKGGFTVLIVLGRKESDQFVSMRGELSSKIQKLFENAKQYHDGRWLWIRLLTKSDADDIKKLLLMKRKPKKNKK
jgi:hypothetical protein